MNLFALLSCRKPKAWLMDEEASFKEPEPVSRISDILSPVFAGISALGSRVAKDIEAAASTAKADFEKAAQDVRTSELTQLTADADAVVTKAFDTLEADVKSFMASLVGQTLVAPPPLPPTSETNAQS